MRKSSSYSTRNKLKADLYELIAQVEGPSSLNMEGLPDDPVEVEGLSDEEIAALAQEYRDERNEQLSRYRRIFPALENDLKTVAFRNLEKSGAYGFIDSDLSAAEFYELGLDLYPLETIHRFCQLAGWKNRQYLDTPEGTGRRLMEPLWILPQ